jgi:photosystem II PsbU protein
MKRFASIIAAVLVILSSWGLVGINNSARALELKVFTVQPTPILAARRNVADDKLGEIQGKLDLNNSDVRDFRSLRGFYPNLASKIIQNAPYKNVEDVLDIPGLSEKQQERLQANLDNFVVTDVSDVMNAGDDRYNPGVY